VSQDTVSMGSDVDLVLLAQVRHDNGNFDFFAPRE
jgi:hypothetical protein